jgi:pentatricopeptide repeat protein
VLALGALVSRAPAQDKSLSLINAYATLSPHIEKAQMAFRKDRLEKCEEEARFCLAKLPEHHEAHFLMSLVLYKRGEYGKALENIQAAEAGYLVISRALFLLGRENAQKRPEDVTRLMDELADLAGAYAVSRSHGNGLADKYDQAFQDARHEMIKDEEERNRSSSSGDAVAIPALYRYWHGNVLFMLKQVREAEAQYRQAIAKDPDFRETYNNLINLLFMGGHVDEARTVLAQAEAHKAKIHPELKKAVLERDRETLAP